MQNACISPSMQSVSDCYTVVLYRAIAMLYTKTHSFRQLGCVLFIYLFIYLFCKIRDLKDLTIRRAFKGSKFLHTNNELPYSICLQFSLGAHVRSFLTLPPILSKRMHFSLLLTNTWLLIHHILTHLGFNNLVLVIQALMWKKFACHHENRPI